MNRRNSMPTRLILLLIITNLMNLSAMAVELVKNHVWMTPDNIGFRIENPAEEKFKEFLAPLTSGSSEQTFKKGEYLEIIVKNYIRGVFYMETRGIYHIGTFEEQGICKATAVQHTWVNVEVVDMRDIAATPLPKDQYKEPVLTPKDWNAIGELSISHPTSPDFRSSCSNEAFIINDFYSFTKEEFGKFFNSNYQRLIDVMTRLISEGTIGEKSIGRNKKNIFNYIDPLLKKQRLDDIKIRVIENIDTKMRSL